MDKNTFDIITQNGILKGVKLELLVERLPFTFFTVDRSVPPEVAFQKHQIENMEVYHEAEVVSIYPPDGKRLSNAVVTNPNFPLRPDNVMDDQLGLRCCYHPRLGSFYITSPNNEGDPCIEIDIHKYPKRR